MRIMVARRPDSIEAIAAEHLQLVWGSTNSGFNIAASDMGETVWTNVIGAAYGLPAAAEGIDGIWSWGDVDSIFVSENTWTNYENGEGETRTEERVEYRQEGFWYYDEGLGYWDFVANSDHDPVVHGDREQYGNTSEMLGVVEYRDGFIEVRDQHWNTIGRFADPANASDFATIASSYEGFEAAWDSVAEYLPGNWDKATAKFSVTDGSDLIVMDDTGVMLGRISSWTDDYSWEDWRGRDVTNTHYRIISMMRTGTIWVRVEATSVL